MGAGLFYDDEGKTVFFEPYENIPAEDSFQEDWTQAEIEGEIRCLREEAWDDALTNLKYGMPEGFTFKHSGEWTRAGRVIGESDLHQIFILEDQGGYDLVFLTVKPRDIDCYDEEQEARLEKAKETLDEVASEIFDKLYHERTLGELRVRDTAWTSKKYEPAAEMAMSPR